MKNDRACFKKNFHLDDSFPEKIITMLCHLKKDGLFDGSPSSLARFGSGNLLRRKNMGLKSLKIIAHKLESLGVINDAKAWLEGSRAGERYMLELDLSQFETREEVEIYISGVLDTYYIETK